MSPGKNPAAFIDLTGGGIDATTGGVQPPQTVAAPAPQVPVVPPAMPAQPVQTAPVIQLPAPVAPAPAQPVTPRKDGLTMEDHGGGPVAGHLAPVVQVRQSGLATTDEEQVLKANAAPATLGAMPVQTAVNDMLSAMMGTAPLAPAPAPMAPAVAQPAPAPRAPMPATTPIAAPAAPTPAGQVPVYAPPPNFTPPTPVSPVAAPVAPAADPVRDASGVWQEIEAVIRGLRKQTGQCVVDNPYDPDFDRHNIVHVAIWNMRYNPGLVDMSAHDLCIYEAALAAHQVWVQSVENWWTARCDFLGPELSKVLRIKRANYKGDTEKAREDAVCAAEPEVEAMRREFLKARAVSTYLRDFSTRFSKLEDGLKRPIDNRQEEENRTAVQSSWNT